MEGACGLLYLAFLLSCDCKCFVSLPCGAVGWSVIVAFAGHNHLLLLHVMQTCILKRILHECSCFIEFIKQVAKK